MSDRAMTGDDRMAFITARARPAVLATTRADGRPHAVPIWIDVDDGAVWFNTGADTVKSRNLARSGVATICVQGDRPLFSFVVVEGTVEIIDDRADTITSRSARRREPTSNTPRKLTSSVAPTSSTVAMSPAQYAAGASDPRKSDDAEVGTLHEVRAGDRADQPDPHDRVNEEEPCQQRPGCVAATHRVSEW